MKSPVVQGNANNPCWNLSHNERVLGISLLSRAKLHCSFTCSSSSAAVCYSCGQGQQKGSAEARAELSDVWMRFNRQHKKPLNKSQHTKAHGQGSSAARLCQGAASRGRCKNHKKLRRYKNREGTDSWVTSPQQESGFSCTTGAQFCCIWDINLARALGGL